MTHQASELVLRFNKKYQLNQILLPATVLLLSFFLLVISLFTDRPDLAVAFRWGAAVVAAIVIPCIVVVARSARRPALRATLGGVHLRNGRVLEWNVFSEALLVNIEGEEWMGFRFRRGIRETFDPETREIIGSQEGWLMAKLACAFPTRSLTVERTKAIERVLAVSRLQLKQHGREILYTRDPKGAKSDNHGQYLGSMFLGCVVAGGLSWALGHTEVIDEELADRIRVLCWFLALNVWHLAVIFDSELPLGGNIFPSRQQKPIQFWIFVVASAVLFNILGMFFLLEAF